MRRLVLAMVAMAALSVAPTVSAQAVADFSVPFTVGERLVFDVRFGNLKVGEGSMEVMQKEEIRGREAWHTRFRVRGGTFFYKVDDLLESWIETSTFSSMRFVQDFDEGGRVRERRYEIFPERSTFQENDGPEEPSVANPLDDGSFLYFIRTVPLEVGQTYTFDRYFRPDRNPVTVKVIGRERVTVPAGTFSTIVIQPIIKAKGIFSDKGEARIWLTEDKYRMMVQMKSKLSFGSLNLYLKSYRPNATTPAR